ncbi:hypothetical protein ACFULT_25560 [Rhodococcus sp. NPDC057297]|uniref:hypothetical protein n=1 Tax=Rhodococcus sp. NPDC057297 TaxID=3346090 RepID=UPI00362B4A67
MANFRTPEAVGDRIAAGMQHDRLPLFNGEAQQDFSPSAHAHPDIATAIDQIRGEARTRPDVRWLEANGFTYARSNATNRPASPTNYGCEAQDCNCGDTGGHPDTGVLVDIRGGNPVDQFRSGAAISVREPYGVKEVHLHDPNVPMFKPNLPWSMTADGGVTPSLVALPVMFDYSTERVARAAMERFASRCYWTGRWTRSADKLARSYCSRTADRGLLVSSGKVTRVFPICDSCAWDLAKDVTPGGWERGTGEDGGRLDYVVNDGWDRAANYPPDKNR